MKKKFIHRKEAYFPFSALSLFCKNWFLSFLAFIFLLIEYFGILPKSAFSDELTPTPTWSQEEYFKKAVPGGRHIELDEAIESTPSVHGVAKPHNREKNQYHQHISILKQKMDLQI
jgi:hypothetical protein